MARAFHWAAVFCVGLLAVPAQAETAPEPYPTFTFKRISAPEAAGQKRITVQIDPAEQAARLALAPLPPP